MSTQRESIIQQVVDLLTPALGSAASMYRSREAALARSEGTAVVVRPDEEVVEFLARGQAKRHLVLSLTVFARGLMPDQVADSVLLTVHNTLMGDDTLAQRVARIIEEGTKWDFEVADQNAVAAEVRYRFTYLTPASRLDALA